MRGVWRFFAGVALVLAILVGGVYLLRGPVTGVALRWTLAKAGVENPSFNVNEISLSRLKIAGLSAGADRRDPALAIETIEVGFDILRLLSERRVASISVGPGSVAITVDDHGALSVAGAKITLKNAQPAPAVLPFDALRIDRLEFAVDAPEGSARGSLTGEFSETEGGELTAAGTAGAVRIGAWGAESASFDGSVRLARDGAFVVDGRLDGDFSTPHGTANGANFSVLGEGGSWRDALSGTRQAPAGSARVELRVAEIPAASSPYLAPLARTNSGAAPAINSISADGAIAVAFAQDRLVIDGVEGSPMRILADRGDQFILSGVDDAPLYERNGAAQSLQIGAVLSGPALTGQARLRARSERDAEWGYDASATLAEQSIAGVSLGATSLAASGAATGAVIDGDLSLATVIRSAAAGVLRISNAPFEANLRTRLDLDAKTLAASTAPNRCVRFERLNFMVEGQDSDGRLTNARLCGRDGPVLTASWSEAVRATLMGDLTAVEGRYRIAKTLFQGAPPSISFNAAYDGVSETTMTSGSLSGGRVLISDSLIAAGADGDFSARFNTVGLTGEVRLASIRLSQNISPVQVAPILATGMARLGDDRIAFSFAASTPAGLPLGVGEGSHAVRTGRGDMAFRSGRIAFTPRGIQPANIIPALKGVIGAAAGEGEGEFAFAWGPSPSDFRSSGAISLDDVSFYGPGRAVTKTGGVTGRLRLSGLSPLTSEGPQTISIKLIDLDALQLENGTARFELPGDDTLRIIEAEFPWFGGKIGAYETVAALTGERAVTALRASNVDLGQMLGYLNIEGLSGEGVVEGVLPISFEEGKARIENGELAAVGPGVVRYQGATTDAAARANAQAKLAFDLLRELHFSKLGAQVNGPLDGTLSFKILFEGVNDVTVNDTRVPSPIIYRISIEAPLLALIEQARVSTDLKLQFERLRERSNDGQ